MIERSDGLLGRLHFFEMQQLPGGNCVSYFFNRGYLSAPGDERETGSATSESVCMYVYPVLADLAT